MVVAESQSRRSLAQYRPMRWCQMRLTMTREVVDWLDRSTLPVEVGHSFSIESGLSPEIAVRVAGLNCPGLLSCRESEFVFTCSVHHRKGPDVMNGQFEMSCSRSPFHAERCRGRKGQFQSGRRYSVWLHFLFFPLHIFGHPHLFVLRMWLIHSWKTLDSRRSYLLICLW